MCAHIKLAFVDQFSQRKLIPEKTKAMEVTMYIISLIFIALSLLLTKTAKRQNKKSPPPPPGPLSLPVIGNLYLLRKPFHRVADRLARTHGPVTWLRFGSRRVVLIASAEAAEECLTRHDVALANRPPFILSRHVGYNYTTMSSASYGDHWRNLRRVAVVEIFSAVRLKKFAAMRRDEARRLLSKLAFGSHQWRRVEMKSILPEMAFNVIFRMVAGDDVLNDPSEASRLREIIKEATESAGAANIADFLPFLKWLGNGFERKAKKLARIYDEFFQGLIDRFRIKEDDKNTLIDHLLSLQQSEPEYYTDIIIKGLVRVLLQAGTATNSVTIEWAISNLLNHPNILKKARKEIDDKIGSNRLVEESDLPELKYLQSVISETMRLNPATPLLLPHFSSEDIVVGGYAVPRDTIFLINAWTIQRDPTLWGSDSGEFRPERFLESEGMSSSWSMMPFGKGRRVCPGAGLAERVVGLGLASMIQCFEWERIGDDPIDMSEGGGGTMPKLVPLEAMCKLRPGFADLIDLA